MTQEYFKVLAVWRERVRDQMEDGAMCAPQDLHSFAIVHAQIRGNLSVIKKLQELTTLEDILAELGD